MDELYILLGDMQQGKDVTAEELGAAIRAAHAVRPTRAPEAVQAMPHDGFSGSQEQLVGHDLAAPSPGGVICSTMHLHDL